MKGSIGLKIRALILVPLALLCAIAVVSFVVLTRHEVNDRTRADEKAASANLAIYLK